MSEETTKVKFEWFKNLFVKIGNGIRVGRDWWKGIFDIFYVKSTTFFTNAFEKIAVFTVDIASKVGIVIGKSEITMLLKLQTFVIFSIITGFLKVPYLGFEKITLWLGTSITDEMKAKVSEIID